MPHKFYHGKTGRVFNVTQHAVGIIVNKQLRGKILPKRINVRVEHISHSKCRQGQRTAEEGSQRERYPRCCQTPAPAAQDRSHGLCKITNPYSWLPFPTSLSPKHLR